MTLLNLVFTFAGAAIGAFGGAYVSNLWAWRQHFVTREEAIEMARAIDELRRVVYGTPQ